MTLAGFPHSGISGSTPTCGSPKLIAAYRALHRLSVPRHPPCALISLDRIVSLRPGLKGEDQSVHLIAYNTRIGALESKAEPSARLLLTQPTTRVFNQLQTFESALTNARPVRTFFPVARVYSSLQKGGDPAAGSPTATLLRLRPSHRARLRPLRPLRVRSRTSGTPGSHGVTGGVYKARERIHRGVADPRLLAIPASCSRVTDCNPNLDRLFPIRSTSRHRNGLYRPL
jgi:hypothetical protein